MLYARILRPPAHGAKLTSVDITAAEKMRGVQVIREGDFIAVLHAQPDGAEKALSLIKAKFDVPESKVDDQTIYGHLLRMAPSGDMIEQKGDLERGRGLAAFVSEGTYLNRYLAHAPMETHTAVANVEGGKVSVWASTQRPFGAKEEVAQALRMSSKDVRVITPFVGGGFGGKSRNRQVVEAARLAKVVGKPVQVAWSREEEFFYDTFQPAAIVKIKSGLNGSKQIVFWDYEVFFAGERSSQCFYDVPHFRTLSHGTWAGGGNGHPFEVGAVAGSGK
jgi:isoquinoline 1-oxidoreductase